jgi:hypothetical protein
VLLHKVARSKICQLRRHGDYSPSCNAITPDHDEVCWCIVADKMNAGRVLQEATSRQLPEGANHQETRVAGRRDYGAPTTAARPEVSYRYSSRLCTTCTICRIYRAAPKRRAVAIPSSLRRQPIQISRGSSAQQVCLESQTSKTQTTQQARRLHTPQIYTPPHTLHQHWIPAAIPTLQSHSHHLPRAKRSHRSLGTCLQNRAPHPTPH